MTAAILCVDDDPLVLDVTRLVLERHGYRVLTSTSGVAAVSLLKEGGEETALVLLDCGMPDALRGALISELKAARPGVRILLTSGSGSAIPLSAEIRAQVDGFIAKPYLPRELIRMVRHALRHGRRSAAA